MRDGVVLERRGQGRGWKECELGEQVPGGSTPYGEGMTQSSDDRHQGARRGEADALPVETRSTDRVWDHLRG